MKCVKDSSLLSLTGISFGSAPAWQHLRKHLVSHLMQPENKRAGLENKIHEEITYLLAECDGSVGKEFDFSQILHAASANITSHSLFGMFAIFID